MSCSDCDDEVVKRKYVISLMSRENAMVLPCSLCERLFKHICYIFIFIFILPHHTYNLKNKKKNKIERIDLTMARRPKRNYEAYIN